MEEGWRRGLGDEWLQSWIIQWFSVLVDHRIYVGLEMSIWCQWQDRNLEEIVCSENLKTKETLETGCLWEEGEGLGQAQVRVWEGSPRLAVSMSNGRDMAVQGREHSVCSSRRPTGNEVSHWQWVAICPWPPRVIPVPFAVLTVLPDLLETSWSWCRGQEQRELSMEIVERF